MSKAKKLPHNVYGLPAAGSAQKTVMICAFEGWNDAGAAASESISFLERTFAASPVENFATEDFYDLTQMRPVLTSQEDGSSQLTWPQLTVSELALSQHNLRILLLSGPEPTYRWKSLLGLIFTFTRSQKVDHLILLGALLAEVPHTRAFPVGISSFSADLQGQAGIERQTYTGPTGITGVLALQAAQHQLTDLSIWVSVPHYAGHPPHPKASFALLQALEAVLDISLLLDPLEEEVHAWERGAVELMEEEPELAEYVAQLEEETDSDPLQGISGEDIAAELERFLKRRDQ